ncbi:RluA family pseudouridine synthase [Parasutterella secunda]|uniref:Pseudouridine synthase n=1 Tax=Parasutterella secunda TaxID=626947 RepID=A0ABS2GR92_9BURK|nr:RluA family pseudouridine synthase [Parasutterella secunda]MBM6928355.1 RluA family pseudouridine synthase [Parasutterella secunda]
MSVTTDEALNFVVEDEFSGERLDKVLARLMPSVSRARLQTWIEQGAVAVNGITVEKIRAKVAAGDEIEVMEQPSPEELAFKPVAMNLDIVYEDDEILVVNKPAGLVVHPAAGHWDDTLLNGLLARNPELKTLPRAGIVHRLDRDTTGLMVVAKTLESQTDLIRQLQARTVKREYWAIVHGQAPEAGFIEEPIMRDPRSPMRFCVGNGPRAKEAKTHVRCVDVGNVPGVGQTPLTVSWVACRLDTGRTHQIRVHMQWAGLPLVGDPVYKGKMGKLPADCPLTIMKRQALHASRLGLVHPKTKENMQWFVPAPQDLTELMESVGFGPTDEPVTVFEK